MRIEAIKLKWGAIELEPNIELDQFFHLFIRNFQIRIDDEDNFTVCVLLLVLKVDKLWILLILICFNFWFNRLIIKEWECDEFSKIIINLTLFPSKVDSFLLFIGIFILKSLIFYLIYSNLHAIDREVMNVRTLRTLTIYPW